MKSAIFEEFSLSYRIDEAIAFILANPTKIGYHLGFSGGKDSIVLAQLFRLAKIEHTLHYSCTTIDPPEVVKFIKEYYPECIFHYPKMSFWHGIMVNNPPTVMARWCCSVLKKSPGKLSDLFLGIRKEESSQRSHYPRINNRQQTKQTFYYPILDWTEADIWELITSYNLPYPSLYDDGLDRLGCIICPFRSLREHNIYRQRYPGVYKVFEKVVTKWWMGKKKAGYAMRHNSPKEYLDSWYENKRIRGQGCSQFAFLNERQHDNAFRLVI